MRRLSRTRGKGLGLGRDRGLGLGLGRGRGLGPGKGRQDGTAKGRGLRRNWENCPHNPKNKTYSSVIDYSCDDTSIVLWSRNDPSQAVEFSWNELLEYYEEIPYEGKRYYGKDLVKFASDLAYFLLEEDN